MLWLVRLFTWDGLLPLAVWSAPYLARLLLPGRRWATEVTGVFVPIVALLIRFVEGRRGIRTNRCGPAMRQIQTAALAAGVFVLMLVDAMVILSHEVPGGLLRTRGDLIGLAVLLAIYFFAMAVATYPGRGTDPKAPGLGSEAG